MVRISIGNSESIVQFVGASSRGHVDATGASSSPPDNDTNSDQ
jgi:hypothetical protein